MSTLMRHGYLLTTTQRSAVARRFTVLVLGACLALTMPATLASAHVGVTPAQVPADSNQTFTVRVPTEKAEPTVQVRLQFPAGLTVSRFQPMPGWTRQVEQDNQQRIIAVTWSGGQIGPGEYQDFAFIGRTPKEIGPLAFKAYQTYQGGETVEWTGAEGQERPGPIVTMTAPTGTATSGGMSIEGPGGVPGASGATASPAATNQTGQPAGAGGATGPSTTAASAGSDLPLLGALAAAVMALIALVLSGIALTRRARVSA